MQITTTPAVNVEVRFPWSHETEYARWPIINYLEQYDPKADDVGGPTEICIIASGLTPEQAEQATAGIQEIAREYGLFL